jgi:hypothetical protein
MTRLRIAAVLLAFASLPAWAATPAEEGEQIRAADARFWQAYNACDTAAMDPLISADVEFYHDKGGLTSGRKALVDSIRNNLCSNPDFHLRRDLVAGSLQFHHLNGGYGLLSGTHVFYVLETGKPERLDGQARFTTLFKLNDGQWQMHRVLSYDHGPAQAAASTPARQPTR